MESESQADAVHAIERALATLRMGLGRGGPGPRGMHGGPRGEGHAPRGDESPGWGDGAPPWSGRRSSPGAHEHGTGGGARLRLLAVLAGAKPDARNGISEIADAIGVDQPRASRLVNDAAMRGLVTRGVDERDARRSVVAITDVGRALLQSTRDARHSAVTAALDGFSPDEAEQFAQLLTRFAASWPTLKQP